MITIWLTKILDLLHVKMPIIINLLTNLINLNRTNIITSGAFSNTTPRLFSENDVWVGISASNYFNRTVITSYSITDNSIIVNSVASAYGIGIPVKCKESTRYKFSCDEEYNVNFGFYNENGEIISTETSQEFITPNNCKWINIVFVSRANDVETTYTNPKLVKEE